MIHFDTIILRFNEHGEKTGWTYIEIPAAIAQKLKPGSKKSFRVRGLLDQYAFSGIALVPMGSGNFIMPLNATIRKGIGKAKGALVQLAIEEDKAYILQTPDELLACLEDEPDASHFFNQLSKSHQSYFIKWIQSAKTEPTQTKRIAQTIHALCNKMNFGEMQRSLKNT